MVKIFFFSSVFVNCVLLQILKVFIKENRSKFESKFVKSFPNFSMF